MNISLDGYCDHTIFNPSQELYDYFALNGKAETQNISRCPHISRQMPGLTVAY
jgi:hypothetical protein